MGWCGYFALADTKYLQRIGWMDSKKTSNVYMETLEETKDKDTQPYKTRRS